MGHQVNLKFVVTIALCLYNFLMLVSPLGWQSPRSSYDTGRNDVVEKCFVDDSYYWFSQINWIEISSYIFYFNQSNHYLFLFRGFEGGQHFCWLIVYFYRTLEFWRYHCRRHNCGDFKNIHGASNNLSAWRMLKIQKHFPVQCFQSFEGSMHREKWFHLLILISTFQKFTALFVGNSIFWRYTACIYHWLHW